MTEASSNQKLVLVVDDEPALLEIVVEELELFGYRTIQATSAEEAVNKLKDHKVDAVVTDINLSKVSGLELLDQIKASNPVFPRVILMSGYVDLSLENLFDRGAEAVFTKPINFEALDETLKRLLSESALMNPERPIRHDMSYPVSLKFESLQTARSEYLLNIGRGGAFIAIEKDPPPPSTLLDLSLTFENGPLSKIDAKAVVRWSRSKTGASGPSGVGVEFLELNPTQRAQLLIFLNALQTKAFIPIK